MLHLASVAMELPPLNFEPVIFRMLAHLSDYLAKSHPSLMWSFPFWGVPTLEVLLKVFKEFLQGGVA
jgi:hypothetical protein